MKYDENNPMAVYVEGETPEQILLRPYGRVLVPEERGGYSASIREFQGCFAEGGTVDETLENLHRAALSWLEAAIEQKWPIPLPEHGE